MTAVIIKILKFFAFFIIILTSGVIAEKGAKIVIEGSDTLGAKMIPQLAEAYNKLGHQVTFEIMAEGSSTCYRALVEDHCDIGMSSRMIKDRELLAFQKNQLQLATHVVAYDMLVVVVNDKNPITNLTKNQVKEIFTGKIRTWKDISAKSLEGKIAVYTRNTSSGTYKNFQKIAMDKLDYCKNTQKVAGSDNPVASVINNPLAIGYSGLAYAKATGIHAISINGIQPRPENVMNYPLSRPLFLYTTQRTSPKAMRFLNWVLTSPEATKIIEQVGFVSAIPSKKKQESK